MKVTKRLQDFLELYETYEREVLKPSYEEVNQILKEWESASYWEKYSLAPGVATPLPVRMVMTRIKHPEKAVDKIYRKPDSFPEGLSQASIGNMHDALGVRVIVYFVSQLPLIDKEIRGSGLFELAQETPPEAYLGSDMVQRLGLAHIEQKHKESGYASVHYTVRLKHSSLPPERRPFFEIQVRTAAQELWSELEHVLAYKPENRTHFSTKRRLQILAKEIDAVDEQFNLLFEELIHSQETASYQDEDLLNSENLPKVLFEAGVRCSLKDLNPLLKLLESRDIRRIRDLLQLATPLRLEMVRNTYMSTLGRGPGSLELGAALAALKGAQSREAEVSRIKSQIAYHLSAPFG